MEEYRIDLKVRNNLILTKIEELGFSTPRSFCKIYDICYISLLKLINMKNPPLIPNGKYRKIVYTLCDILGCIPEELFSAKQMEVALETNKRTLQVKEAEMLFMINQSETLLLEEIIDNDNMKKTLEEKLFTLTSREKKVLELRFGLNNEDENTLKEVGEKFGVDKERIRQIESKSLRKLRHPDRSDSLRSYIE